MTVQLSISRVREEIYLAAGGPDIEAANRPAILLLAGIFYESFAKLFGNDRRFQWRPVIASADPKIKEWHRNLENHVYKRLIGPRLGREQVHLHDRTELVVAFWQAAQSMCHWIVQLLWRSRRELARDAEPPLKLLTPDPEPLWLELKEQEWTDAVTLTGIADLVLRVPGERHWCIVELTLGQACPEAALTQFCLYHKILSSLHPEAVGALSLVEFKPHREEHSFDAVELKNAQKRLLDVIGRLAGVMPGKKRIREQHKAAFYKEQDPQTSFEQGKRLVSIFREFGTPLSLAGDPVSGPSFIRYPIKIGKGLKLGATQGIARAVQHRLHLSTPPYVHTAGGSGVVDIQRADRQIVYFSQIRDQLPEADSEAGCCHVLLGIDLYNRLRFADLSDQRNAHILIAGKAGSGKSEWLRSVLAGFILTNTPDTLRLVLIDPQKNVFNELKGSAFLLSSNTLVYPDEQPVAKVLSRLADEMDRRHRILQNAGVDTRDALIRKSKRTMPRIVCICDEYFDLINQAPGTRRAVESQIFRLGPKSRAAGIHLIIATRQPSRQVIMGALNANIPARLGFKMGRAVESNMLLNQTGAEYLLGRGDLLFKDIGEPIRLQAPYIVPEQRIKLYQT